MEQIFKVIATALGGLVGYLWGGWSTLMGILLAFVVIDYATGLFASALEGRLSSKVGFFKSAFNFIKERINNGTYF